MALQSDPFEGLSPEAKEVLSLILRQHITDGSTLMKHLGVTKAKEESAVNSLRQLEGRDLIEVAGALTREELPFTRFNVRPSAKDYLDRMLRYAK